MNVERKAIHKDGPVLSRIVSGAWRWDKESTNVEALIHKSIDAGIPTFDHPDILVMTAKTTCSHFSCNWNHKTLAHC